MLVGVPRERADRERRVAATPETVRKLVASGHEVVVESGAGLESGVTDDAYVEAGARLASLASSVLAEADLVLKVRPPTPDEVASMSEETVLISLLFPDRNPETMAALTSKKITAVALEKIPRVTRAQKMDVLSSMGNLAGYRAVVEAANRFEGFFGKQVTAAGATKPARVLVIGAGVAGLAAIGAARALGAEVRAFDTRAAAREQVESLGARFLTIQMDESGEGKGGYAKAMSKEFIEAEMALFRAQAAEVDIIITTALVPGLRAPVLLPTDVVEAMRPGSIVVDLAAEQGGNCELTRRDEVVEHRGVRVLGFTDLTSRMAATSSRFFATNVHHLVTEMGGAEFRVDLDDDVIRAAVVLHRGALLPPQAAKEPHRPHIAKSVRPPSTTAQSVQQGIMDPTRRAWGTTVSGMAMIAVLFVLGRFAPQDFLQHFTVFILACFVGWQVIWSVTPALHTPLMSVTNAISGIIIVGGMLQIGPTVDLASVLGALAVLFASINIAGGFLVTQRMLKMFRREGGAR